LGEIALKFEEVFMYGKNWQLPEIYSVNFCVLPHGAISVHSVELGNIK